MTSCVPEDAPVTSAETVGAPAWRDLDLARAPSEPERRLLVTLAAAVAEPLLHDHVATRAERAIPPETAAQLSDTGRDDYVAVRASAAGSPVGPVDVVLHVIDGHVGELEVFAVHGGEGVAISLADLGELTDVSVG